MRKIHELFIKLNTICVSVASLSRLSSSLSLPTPPYLKTKFFLWPWNCFPIVLAARTFSPCLSPPPPLGFPLTIRFIADNRYTGATLP